MAEEYDNFFRCKSNPDFIIRIAPHEIMKISNAEFISFQNGQYYFQSVRWSIYKAIHHITKKYPDEEFELDYWNADPMVSEKITISFKGDCSEIVGTEPIFHFSYSPYLKKVVGTDVLNNFLEKVNNYFEAIKPFFQNNEGGNWDEGISIQYDDFKLEAVLTFGSLIEIRGYLKTISGSWEMIDEKSLVRKKSGSKPEYENYSPIVYTEMYDEKSFKTVADFDKEAPKSQKDNSDSNQFDNGKS